MSAYIEDVCDVLKTLALSNQKVEKQQVSSTSRPGVHANIVIESDPRGERGRRRENGYLKSQPTTVKGGYPLRILIPENAGCVTGCPWVYPMTFGGGLVAGDRIEVDLTLKENCAALLTSQESTKVYHCPSGVVTEQAYDFTVQQGSLLCVLPDPIVCYKDADYKQCQTVHMSCGGNIAMLDWYLAGRVARGEMWTFKRFVNELNVKVNGRLVLRERVDLSDKGNVPLSIAMRGYQVMGTFLLLGQKVVDLSEQLYSNFGLPKPFGSKYDPSCMVSAKKLSYQVGEKELTGVYLKVMAETTALAFEQIKKMAEPLCEIIGGDPFHNKF